MSKNTHIDKHSESRNATNSDFDKLKKQINNCITIINLLYKRINELLDILEVKRSIRGKNIQKPFLKWVGGKTQIIDKIISKIPAQMNNYHELFLGGGSVLLAILSLQKQNKILIKNRVFAYDININLINVYKNIQNNKEELLDFIKYYFKEYESIKKFKIFQSDEFTRLEKKIKKQKEKITEKEREIYEKLKKTKRELESKFRNPKNIKEAKSSKESYYYWIRNRYNTIDKNTVECSALFIVINKLCFRGMYREGSDGRYNIGYGNYKKTPTAISKTDIDTISELIKDVEFKHCSFTESIKNVKDGDFVYLDPPYAPENKDSFVDYVAGGFNLEKHKLLFSEIKKMKNIKFVMSNAKASLVTDNFKEYNCDDIIVRRAINSKEPGSTTTEVIIYN